MDEPATDTGDDGENDQEITEVPEEQTPEGAAVDAQEAFASIANGQDPSPIKLNVGTNLRNDEAATAGSTTPDITETETQDDPTTVQTLGDDGVVPGLSAEPTLVQTFTQPGPSAPWGSASSGADASPAEGDEPGSIVTVEATGDSSQDPQLRSSETAALPLASGSDTATEATEATPSSTTGSINSTPQQPQTIGLSQDEVFEQMQQLNALGAPANLNTSPSLQDDPLKISILGSRINHALSLPIAQISHETGSSMVPPQVLSATAPSNSEHATVWSSVVQGKSISTTGGAVLDRAVLVNPSSPGPLVHHTQATVQSQGTDKINPARNPILLSVPPSSTAPATLTSTQDDDPGKLPPALTKTDVLQTAPASLTPPGFVLTGSTKVFGSIDAQLYSFHGVASNGQQEIAVLTAGNELGIGDLLPFLKGTIVDDIKLNDTQLSYNELPLRTRQYGLWFETTVTFTGKLQIIQDTLKSIFQQDRPSLKLSALLSNYLDWTTVPVPTSFNIEAAILGMAVPCGDHVTFTTVTVSLEVIRERAVIYPYTEKHVCRLGFYGALNLVVPGSIAPLQLNYSMQSEESSYHLEMSLPDANWQPAFGINGLNLVDASFSVDIPKKGSMQGLQFAVNASLNVESVSVTLDGHYTSKDDWELSTDLEDFDLNDLLTLYDELFGVELHPFEHDISFSSLTLRINNEGIVINGAATIEEHTSASATVSLTKIGIDVKGEVADFTPIEGVTIKDATLEITINKTGIAEKGKAGSGLTARFVVTGDVSLGDNLNLKAGVYYERGADKQLLWSLYGEILALKDPVSLARIEPALKGTPLDIAIEDVVVAASNNDNPQITVPNKFNYPLVKGFQVYASLDSITSVNKAMSSNASRLMLGAVYAKGQFALDFRFATAKKMSLGKSISSSEVDLKIIVEPIPQLQISAQYAVTVHGQKDPLTFAMGLNIDILQASGFGSIGNWNNPFGISKSLTVEELTIQVGIVYAGGVYPSTLGFAGKILVDKTDAGIVFLLSEDPEDELLVVTIDNLKIIQLVNLAGRLLEKDLPTPPDFLDFKAFKLYISTGATIGLTYYPAGFAFDADIVLFGKEGSVKCEVDKTKRAITIDGSIDAFKLGPLSVQGLTPPVGSQSKDPPKALFNLELGLGNGHLLLDGKVELFDLMASIHLEITMQTDLVQIVFDFELDFTEHLKLSIKATLAIGENEKPQDTVAGTASHDTLGQLRDMSGLDFNLEVDFQQDLVDYMVAQANTWFLAARKQVDSEFSTLQQHLDQAEKDFNTAIDTAQKDLDTKLVVWQKKQAQVHGEFDRVNQSAQSEAQRLQSDVDAAKAKFDAVINALEKKLEDTKEKEALAITNAENAVTQEQLKADNTIAAKMQSLHDAQTAVTRDFGEAEQALQDAKNKVEDAQANLNAANNGIQQAQSNLDNCSWYEKIPKGLELAEAKGRQVVENAACDIAEGILAGAERIVQGPAYLLAQSLVSDAEKALEGARTIADAALDAVKKGLTDIKAAQALLVNAAETALETARTTCNELKVWDSAKEILVSAAKLAVAAINAAQKAIDGLLSCAEYLAYEAATEALKFAKANSKDLDIAKHAVSVVQDGTDLVLEAGQWMVNAAGNIFDVQKVHVQGSLQALLSEDPEKKKPLIAHVEFRFMGHEDVIDINYLPGSTGAFLKGLFEEVWTRFKGGNYKAVK